MSQRLLLVILTTSIGIIVVLLSILLLHRAANVKEKLTFTSHVSNISITPQNKDLAINLLDSWGLYTQDVALDNVAIQSVRVNTVHIVLTPLVQPYDTFVALDETTVIQSTGQSFKDGVLTISVYLHPDQILTQDAESIANWLSNAALLRIYSIIQNKTVSQELFVDAISNLNQKSIVYVQKN